LFILQQTMKRTTGSRESLQKPSAAKLLGVQRLTL
jgi:hypothetical protein